MYLSIAVVLLFWRWSAALLLLCGFAFVLGNGKTSISIFACAIDGDWDWGAMRNGEAQLINSGLTTHFHFTISLFSWTFSRVMLCFDIVLNADVSIGTYF